MELKKSILTRRTQRKFTDYYVTDEELVEIIEAAKMAPSWANTQVWEYIIIRDKDLILKVTETYSKTNPARKCSETASAIIVALAKKNISGCKEGKTRTKFNEWNMFDLGMSVQNISLMAHDMGLGTVIVGSIDHDKCADILSVTGEYDVICTIPIGRPVTYLKNPPPKRDIKDFLHLNMFNEMFIPM